jgi:formaldehyde-activating enzyme involved in methanogenesis
MAVQQSQIELTNSQTAALIAQSQESAARAVKLAIEADIAPKELQIDLINAITRNLKEGDGEDKEFDRRLKTAQTLLKEREIKGKENANRPRTPFALEERRQLPQAEVGSLRSVGENVL